MGVTMRTAPLLVLGCLVSAPALAGVWSNLWRTPNQQGQALLAAGRPAQAAARFTSARRKAYADLEAGRYAPAARLLAPFKDATSEYNRGNALAHLGHLHAALAAYDAALKQTPHDRDIRHNRDLIERILAHRPARPQAPTHGGAGNEQNQGSSHRTRSAPHSGQHGSPHSKGTSGRGGAQQRAGHGQRSGQGQKPGRRRARNSRAAMRGGAHRHGPQSQAAARAGDRSGEKRTPQGTASATRPGARAHPVAHSPGQTRRDAALAAAIARRQRRASPSGAAIGAQRHGPHAVARTLLSRAGGARTPPAKPVSEKRLALDQWLRQIPNDPAGLLRRKFLIEYLLRHPGANP
jgi:Ca-activated chloride channel family protein